MTIVLSEPSNTDQSIKFAALLHSIDGAKLRIPQRKSAIASWLCSVSLNVHGTVHRFEEKFTLLNTNGLIHAIGIIGVVSRRLV